jgi:hypothetical protein
MSLSPLAERIYQTLLQQLRLPNPLISYGDLVRALGPLPPPDTNLKANDQRLFEALGEIFRACQSNKPPLPALTSIVVRRTADGSLGTPGLGYFALAFPQVREETARLQIWQEQVKCVAAFSYPEELNSVAFSRSGEQRVARRWFQEPTVIAAIIGLAGTLLAVIIQGWLSSHRGETSAPRQAELPAVQKARLSDKPPQPPQVEPPEVKNAPKLLTLDDVLDVLERHHQRATFGAVAGILGREPQSLFNGHTRTPKTSWVVNTDTGLPTGTKERDFPPALLEKQRVIKAPDELREWLRDHH